MYFSANAFNFHTQTNRFENLDNWIEVCAFLHNFTHRGFRTFTVTAFNETGEVGTKTYRTMMDLESNAVKVFGEGSLRGFVDATE